MRETDIRESGSDSIRESSEFMKTVTDFARYAHKEYIDGHDGRSLIISAIEKETGMQHAILGDGELATAGLVSMMKQRGLAPMFRRAYVVATEMGDDNLAAAVSRRRKALRSTYVTFAACGLWTLCLIALQVLGLAHWITTVSSLLLMAVTLFILGCRIDELRRSLKKLSRRADGDTLERARRELAEQKDMIAGMKRRLDALLNGEDDED